MKTMKLLAVMCVLGGLTVGCGSTAVTPDSGPVGGADTGPTGTDGGPLSDSGPPPASLPVFPTDMMGQDILIVADRGATATMPTGMPPDWGCIGTATAPTPGAAVSYRIKVLDFQSDRPNPAGTTINVFRDNIITPGTCTGTCQMLTLDAMGFATAMGEQGGWFGYEVPPNTISTMSTMRPARTFQINVTTPAAGAEAEVNSVSQSTRTVIPTIAGLRLQSGSVVFAGAFRDCARNEVRGAIISILAPDGTRIVATGAMDGPGFFYFTNASSALPDPSQPYTNTNGLYAAANLPASSGLFRVEAWAKTANGAAPRLVACEAGQAIPDAVNILSLTPLRGDYPAGHPCRGATSQ